MWRLALRTLAAHRARLLMTIAAVCVGSAFIAGTLVFTASAERATLSAPEPEAAQAAPARPAEDRRARLDETRTLRNAMLGFAGIATLVGGFVIANTFSMLVGRRTRELALLRALGMTRRQVRRTVLGEALAVGLLGAAAGTAAGWGLAALAVRRFLDRGGEAPVPVVVTWAALAVPLAVGVGATVLSAYASARRAARVAPVAAMRGEATSLRADIRRRTVAGLVVAAPAVATYAWAALTGGIDEQVGLVGIGAVALLILAAILLAPALCRLLLGPLSAPAVRLGAVGRLAAGNARRNPRRTAATASALMVSLSVVSGFAIFGQSVKDGITSTVRRDVAAELVVTPAAGRDPTIPQGEIEQAAALPGVRAVAALRYALQPVRIGPLRTQAPLTVVDPAAAEAALRLPMTSGSVADLTRGALVSADLAASHALSVGDRVAVTWPRGGERELEITGVYQGSRIASGLLVPESEALPRLDRQEASVAFVALDPGADQAAVRASLERSVADRPDVAVRSRAEYLDDQLGAVDAPLGILYGLLAFAVVIGILGVVNTLALSVLERTREIGLLRALGLTRRQLRAVVRIESLLVVAIGGLLGMAGGYLFGAMFQRAALGTGLLDAAVPGGQLALALAGLGLVGVAAAAWPAARAARTDVLAAIAAE